MQKTIESIASSRCGLPKNTICLWFDKDAHDAARFYAATFPNSKMTAVSQSAYPGGKKGDLLTVEFTVVGIPCLGLAPAADGDIHNGDEPAGYLKTVAGRRGQFTNCHPQGLAPEGDNADSCERRRATADCPHVVVTSIRRRRPRSVHRRRSASATELGRQTRGDGSSSAEKIAIDERHFAVKATEAVQPTDPARRPLGGRQERLSHCDPREVTYYQVVTCRPANRRKSASLNVTTVRS